MSICVNGLFSEVTIYGSSFPFFKLTSDLIGWRQDWLQRNGSKFQFINLFSLYTILYKIPYNTSVDRLEQTSLGSIEKLDFFVENCSRATPRDQNIAFILTTFDKSRKNSLQLSTVESKILLEKNTNLYIFFAYLFRIGFNGCFTAKIHFQLTGYWLNFTFKS